jgi:rRNA maturation RNase YbeY
VIRLQIETDPKFISPVKDICASVLTNVFTDQDIASANITLIFGKDELLTQLKKKYFGKDHLTDVIAFRLNDKSEQQIDGEIYISFPRAKENALKFDEPFKKEITRLMIHGSLHLIGYTDDTSNTMNEMTKLEDQYLENKIWKDILPAGEKMINE